MIKYNVFKPVHWLHVPPGTKVIDFTWVMKKKPNRSYLAISLVRTQYSKNYEYTPVISNMGIMIVLCLIVFGNLYAWMTNVEGIFLNGNFQKKAENIHTKVPKGLMHLYPPWFFFTNNAHYVWYYSMVLKDARFITISSMKIICVRSLYVLKCINKRLHIFLLRTNVSFFFATDENSDNRNKKVPYFIHDYWWRRDEELFWDV